MKLANIFAELIYAISKKKNLSYISEFGDKIEINDHVITIYDSYGMQTVELSISTEWKKNDSNSGIN